MSKLRSRRQPVTSYLDQLDDEYLDVVAKLPSSRPGGVRKNSRAISTDGVRTPRVLYSTDGDTIERYRVEINSDAASTALGSEFALAQPKIKKRSGRLPTPRFKYHEDLQQDVLEDFESVGFRYESDFEVDMLKAARETESSHRKRSNLGIETSSASFPPEHAPPKTPQTYNMFCGGDMFCFPAKPSCEPPTQKMSAGCIAPYSLERHVQSLRKQASSMFERSAADESSPVSNATSANDSKVILESPVGDMNESVLDNKSIAETTVDDDTATIDTDDDVVDSLYSYSEYQRIRTRSQIPAGGCTILDRFWSVISTGSKDWHYLDDDLTIGMGDLTMSTTQSFSTASRSFDLSHSLTGDISRTFTGDLASIASTEITEGAIATFDEEPLSERTRPRQQIERR